MVDVILGGDFLGGARRVLLRFEFSLDSTQVIKMQENWNVSFRAFIFVFFLQFNTIIERILDQCHRSVDFIDFLEVIAGEYSSTVANRHTMIFYIILWKVLLFEIVIKLSVRLLVLVELKWFHIVVVFCNRIRCDYLITASDYTFLAVRLLILNFPL